MAKYYDEPRRDTSTSTLTDETPKYQKAAQRKKVAKGCPALDGDAHIYGAHKVIRRDLVFNKTYIQLSKISCAFCGHTRKVSKTLNKHQLEVVHTTIYTIKEHLSFGKFYGRIDEYDYDADEKGRKL